jgi:serine protease
MPWRRCILGCAAVAALWLVAPSVGRTQGALDLRVGVGSPAIEQNITERSARSTPGSTIASTSAAVRQTWRPDRIGRAGGRYLPGRLVVKFKDGMTDAERLAAVEAVVPGAALESRPSYADFDVVRVDASADAEALADRLSAGGSVVYAQPAYRWTTEFTPNDPLYAAYQWNLPLVDLERAWDIQPQAGASITVAVLDTGIAYTTATLVENLPNLGPTTIPYANAPQLGAQSRFVKPHDFIWDTDTPLDFDGHGTHVSGTIGQLTNDGIGTAGIAFDVKLMPVKVLDSAWDDIFGSPNVGTDDVIAEGIRYAADNGAQVINMSLGREGPAAPAVEDAIRYAVGKGTFVSIAGGNGFENGNPVEVLAEIASRVPGAVSVAAVDRSKNHAYYSTTGSYIELAAPGGGGGATDDGYVWQQTFDPTYTDTYLLSPDQLVAPRFDIFAYVGYAGTSMAAAHVSGIAAMVMQQGIRSPAAVEAALERFATDLGAPGRDDTYGFGLVDARNAIYGLGVAK